MYKLIAILIAAMPVILFLRTVFFRNSKVIAEASSAFRKQVDYLVWMILFLVACALSTRSRCSSILFGSDAGAFRPLVELLPHDGRAFAERHQFSKSRRARKIFHPAVRRWDQPLRIDELQSRPNAVRDHLRGFDRFVSRVRSRPARWSCREILENAEVELGLRRLDGYLVSLAASQLRQKRITDRLLLRHHRAVAKTKMHQGRHLQSGKRTIERAHRDALGSVGIVAKPRIVDLDHVGAGGLQRVPPRSPRRRSPSPSRRRPCRSRSWPVAPW